MTGNHYKVAVEEAKMDAYHATKMMLRCGYPVTVTFINSQGELMKVTFSPNGPPLTEAEWLKVTSADQC